MRIALETGFPRLKAIPIEDERSISIACYGPSLADTWRDLTHPIISVSGALKFLVERGIKPDYHVDVDPRLHKTKHISPPVEGVHYIMASCCHPEAWPLLRGQRVSLVHCYSSESTKAWIAENDPAELLIQPGSTVGMAAIHVGGLLGYRHFEIHGMDGSFRDGKRHAGPHYGHPQGGYTWAAGGVTYDTSRIMSNGCAEVINTCHMFPIFCVFHGNGLQQALIAEEPNLPNAALAGTPDADRVRKLRLVYEKPVQENQRIEDVEAEIRAMLTA